MIKFEESTHTYTYNGKEFISCTTLLKKYGLTADYSGIPKNVLEKAAKKGTAMHKALEMHVKGVPGVGNLVPEVGLFENYVKLRGIDLTTATPEFIVYDTDYEIAGTVDIKYYDDVDLVLADFKRTSKLHIESVAWQASIYNFLDCKGDMIQYYFRNLKALHFTLGKLYVKDLHTVDYDQVKALLDAYKRGDATFNYVKPNNIIVPSKELLVEQLLNELGNAKDHVKKLDKELKEILEEVKENFVKQKEYSHKTPTLALTYVSPSHRKNLHKGKVEEFLTLHGEVLDDYYTTTIVKDRVQAKIVVPKPAGNTDGT